MNKSIISLTLGLLLAGNCLLPVRAEDSAAAADSSSTTATTPDSQATQKPAKKAKASKKDKKSDAPAPAASSSSESTPSSSDSSSSAESKNSSKDSTKSAKTKKAHGGGGANWALAVVSFPVCSVVGIPIAIIRKAKPEGVAATKELCGESANPVVFGACAMIGLPGGLLTALTTGVVNGFLDSAKNAADEPFSKDAVSLGDMSF